MNKFLAYRMHKENGNVKGRLEKISLEDLNPGEVIVRVHYSSMNFKDALGPMGRGKIQRRFPIVVGIDFAGIVEYSTVSEFAPGDRVFGNGCDLGEKRDGGYTEILRVASSILMHLPSGLSPHEAMALGTAGFTAALCLHRMEENGQNPRQGEILVTGASGGVGSCALQIFSQAGYEMIAVSGKKNVCDYLSRLGAKTILTPAELQLGKNPLEQARWAGCIDNVGGELLPGVLRHIDLWGNVASVGLAGRAEFHSTVMPHILRGVSILGISSNNCTMDLRKNLWQKLAAEWKPKNLQEIIAGTIPLQDLENAFHSLLNREVQGRIVVQCSKEP